MRLQPPTPQRPSTTSFSSSSVIFRFLFQGLVHLVSTPPNYSLTDIRDVSTLLATTTHSLHSTIDTNAVHFLASFSLSLFLHPPPSPPLPDSLPTVVYPFSWAALPWPRPRAPPPRPSGLLPPFPLVSPASRRFSIFSIEPSYFGAGASSARCAASTSLKSMMA